MIRCPHCKEILTLHSNSAPIGIAPTRVCILCGRKPDFSTIVAYDQQEREIKARAILGL